MRIVRPSWNSWWSDCSRYLKGLKAPKSTEYDSTRTQRDLSLKKARFQPVDSNGEDKIQELLEWVRKWNRYIFMPTICRKMAWWKMTLRNVCGPLWRTALIQQKSKLDSTIRRNQKRQLSGMEATQRRRADRQQDMRCSYPNYELALSGIWAHRQRAPRHEGVHERGVNAPKLLKDLVCAIVKDNPRILRKGKTAGTYWACQNAVSFKYTTSQGNSVSSNGPMFFLHSSVHNIW